MHGDLSWPLERATRLAAGATALLAGTREVTYAELAQRVAALGESLDALAIEPGARVGVLAANSIAHVECLLAVPAFGRVIVSLNFRLAIDELAFIVDDAGIALLVCDPEHLELARALRTRCPALAHLVLDGPISTDTVPYEELVAGAGAPPPAGTQQGLAAISYTGGTTGRPKGVMLSHDNLLSNAAHNMVATGHARTDVWLHVCPMFHVAGTANLLAATWVGAMQVVLPRFEPAAVLDAIARERVTHTVLVPTMLSMLVDDPRLREADLGSLCHIQYAASPIAPELQRRVLDALDCDVAQFYGMTEAAPTVTHLSPVDHRRGQAGEEPYATRLRSMGVPVAGVQVEVRTGTGDAAASGTVGEVHVRGPNVMLGYWRRPEATEAALADGWYRTGDAAYADADGYLYLVDRLKDMIITGGENVYSVEVEAALLEHPDVEDAAVFGIPHDRWGEAVHAVLKVREGAELSSDGVMRHCRGRIAGFKVPRTVDVRREPLPRSGAGKLLKNRLREPYWVGHERRVG